MPLVSYAVARRAGAVCTSHRTPQVTVPLPKYNGPTTHSAHDTLLPARHLLGFVVSLSLVFSQTLGAQRVTGPWEDGTIAPRGILRIGISPRFGQWKERHSRLDGTREPLGADYTLDSLGRSVFPFVTGLAPALTTLTGLPAPPLSLGSLRTHLDVTEVTTTTSLEYGLTSRLGLQVVVPYVKNRVHVAAIANPGGVGATLGFNPAQSISAARQQNGLVVTTLGTAASTLSSELTRCFGSSDPTCTAINANRAGATALVQTTGQVSAALAAVYGTPAIAGGLYAPVAGSALHSAVDARLTNLNTQFRMFLGAPASGEWIGNRPVPAVPLAADGLDALLGDPALGIAGRT